MGQKPGKGRVRKVNKRYELAIFVGSDSDYGIITESGMLDILDACGIEWTFGKCSAHRNADDVGPECVALMDNGCHLFMGIAGMAAHLAGALAGHTKGRKMIIGVPLPSDILDGMDALLSMVRMPPGMPVSVVGIGKSGLKNAAILAAQVLAHTDGNVEEKLDAYQTANTPKSQMDVMDYIRYRAGEKLPAKAKK